MLDYAMRKAMDAKEEELCFTITSRKLSRHPKEELADLDFADDIALLSDQLSPAQKLLTNVETECKRMNIGPNSWPITSMSISHRTL